MSSSTTTMSAPTNTSTNTSTSNNSNGGPSSPLLFFVALGFGVVFTNLWIIVGVKYCFRYNQRNRARMAAEEGAVDLANMPPRRRKREKKLMSIDEVNDRFPLTKYKAWRSNRADQGLPTAGGIADTTSRPASIRNVPRDTQGENMHHEKMPSVTTASPALVLEKSKADELAQGLDHAAPEATGNTLALSTSAQPNQKVTATGSATRASLEPAATQVRNSEEGDEDQIETAIPQEQLPELGDTCAICLDVIEEDDDIRGLSCGHAFHASCVDPWLTSRRACCPLCKADYHVPKPRQEGGQTDGRRSDLPPTPFSIMTSGRPGRSGRGRFVFGLPSFSRQQQRSQSTQQDASEDAIHPADQRSSQAPEITFSEAPQPRRQRIRLPSMPTLSRIRRGRGNETGTQPEDPLTPAQLEAGGR